MTDDFRALAPSEVARLIESAAAAIRAEFAAHPDDVLGMASGAGRVVRQGGSRPPHRERAPRLRRPDSSDTWPATSRASKRGIRREVARARRDCQRPASALLAELDALRRDSAALVAGLRPADLERGGRHPTVGRLRVGDLLHEWVHHDRNHLRQVLANTQAAAWPHMGNARRFTTGLARLRPPLRGRAAPDARDARPTDH